MEQKLVQRCETKVYADACKASYWDFHKDNDKGGDKKKKN